MGAFTTGPGASDKGGYLAADRTFAYTEKITGTHTITDASFYFDALGGNGACSVGWVYGITAQKSKSDSTYLSGISPGSVATISGLHIDGIDDATAVYVESGWISGGAGNCWTYDANGFADYNEHTYTQDLELEAAWEVSGVTPPTVTTQAVTSIQRYTATGNGNVTDTGGAITERGVCWNTAGTPTTADSTAHDHTSATGAFTMPMTGLNPSTKYYARAYCINATGTAYGSEVEFTTLGGVILPF